MKLVYYILRLHLETRLLIIAAVGDTALTLSLLSTNLAVEGNPIMRFFLARGVLWFVGFKMFALLPAFLLECRRICAAERAKRCLRAGFALYVGVYSFGVFAQVPLALLR